MVIGEWMGLLSFVWVDVMLSTTYSWINTKGRSGSMCVPVCVGYIHICDCMCVSVCLHGVYLCRWYVFACGLPIFILCLLHSSICLFIGSGTHFFISIYIHYHMPFLLWPLHLPISLQLLSLNDTNEHSTIFYLQVHSESTACTDIHRVSGTFSGDPPHQHGGGASQNFFPS